MSAKVLTIEEAEKANIAVIRNGKGTQAVHDMVVALQANRRSGTANTKTKAEVNLSGAKPYRQKGTGNARAGYKSSPIWRGGGVVFGPKPRDYSKKVTRSVRRLALRKAVSARLIAGDILLIDQPVLAEAKTKHFVSFLEANAPGARKVLVLAVSFDEAVYRAARNLQTVLLMTAAEVNVEHLLKYDKVLITGDALAKIAERMAS